MLALAAAVVIVPGASAGPFDAEKMGCTGEDPVVCPAGTTGQPYSLTLYLLPPDSSRGEDFQCAVFKTTSGTFPPGLSIVDGGYIRGTPTTAGTFSFYLTVTYDRKESCAFDDPPRYKVPSDGRIVIPITPGLPKLTLGPASTVPGTIGTPYSLQMTATVSEPKTWSIVSGQLPPGLNLDASTGLISGTPTTAGTYSFQVLAKVNADSRSDTKWLTVVVRSPLAITPSAPLSPSGPTLWEVGVPLDATLAASGGTGTYTFSLASGSLPDGVAIAADGTLSGTPQTFGTSRATIRLSDGEGRTASYAAVFTVAPRLAITTIALRPGKVGRVYTGKVTAVGGVKPTLWKLKGTKPPRGIRFDRTLGTLRGLPAARGVYRMTFEAVDALGVTATRTLRLIVAP